MKTLLSVICLAAFNSVCLASEGEKTETPKKTKTSKFSGAFEGGELFFSPSVVRVLTITPNQAETGGSGVVVSEDGLILTSSESIESGPLITHQVVSSGGGQSLPAKFLGSDPLTGIAVLRVEGVELSAAKVGEEGSLEEGDRVTAVGLGPDFLQVRSAGAVSMIGQKSLGLIPSGYENFIQTDVPVGEVHAGGALMDSEGKWVGLNFQPLPERSHLLPAGTGVAIPASMALSIADKLIEGGGTIRRGLLGIFLKDLTAEVAAGLGRKENEGVLVANVGKGSPAEMAGIKAGAVILELNGQLVTSLLDLRLAVSDKTPGSDVELEIFQDGEAATISVTLGELPERR